MKLPSFAIQLNLSSLLGNLAMENIHVFSSRNAALYDIASGKKKILLKQEDDDSDIIEEFSAYPPGRSRNLTGTILGAFYDYTYMPDGTPIRSKKSSQREITTIRLQEKCHYGYTEKSETKKTGDFYTDECVFHI